MATTPDQQFLNLLGTSELAFRISVAGPTIYQGDADPTVTPPTPIGASLNDGDFYLRTGAGFEGLWVMSGAVFVELASAAGIISAGDITMGAGSQVLLDATAGAGAPGLSFTGDTNTGVFTSGANSVDFATAGLSRFSIESDGTLSSNTASYEALVLADNDIPNRKFLTDNFIGFSGGTVTGDVMFGAGAQLLMDSTSTLGAPGVSVDTDTDTGIYPPAAGILAFVQNANEIFRISSAGLSMAAGEQFLAASGSVGSPAISTTGATTSGMYFSGSDILLGTAGVERLNLTSTDLTSAVRWRGVDGTAGAPSVSFSGATNIGMFRDTTSLKFATALGEVLELQTDGTITALAGGYEALVLADDDIPNRLFLFNNFLALSGGSMTGDINMTGSARFFANETVDTAAAPSYSFVGASTSGMYMNGTDLAFTGGGSNKMTLRAAQLDSNIIWGGPDGTAALPALSFDSDLTTGLYLSSHLNVSVSATNTWRFSTNTNFIGVQSSNTIQALDSTQGSSLSIRGGVSSGAGNAGGALITQGGTGFTTGAGGTALFRGGQGGATGDGGVTTVTGGNGGPTSGAGADLELEGGATAATATEDGGDVLLSGGVANGSGTDGVVRVTNSALKLVVSAKASLPGSLGAAGAPEAGLLQFVTDDAGATAFVLAYSDAAPTWKRIDDNTNIA